MQHGMFDDGGTWLFNSKEETLAYQLSDEGYDVWITNSRGTVYSNVHKTFTIRDSDFWEFSFDEMGRWDVPANLKFILKKTGFE